MQLHGHRHRGSASTSGVPLLGRIATLGYERSDSLLIIMASLSAFLRHVIRTKRKTSNNDYLDSKTDSVLYARFIVVKTMDEPPIKHSIFMM
jgi:hypothetical protein